MESFDENIIITYADYCFCAEDYMHMFFTSSLFM